MREGLDGKGGEEWREPGMETAKIKVKVKKIKKKKKIEKRAKVKGLVRGRKKREGIKREK